MLRTFFRVVVAGIALGSASLLAQDAVLSHFYGQGVHRFFARDYVGAFEDFNTAIENGSDDPRCYYYRGLTYLHLGREDEAKTDFEKGAQLEMQSAGKFFNVSKALERIQGRQRLMIEQYRSKARLAVMVELERQRKARYEELRREEARVLDQAPPPVGIPEAAPAQQATQPPATEPAAPAQPMPAQPEAPAQPAEPTAPAQPAAPAQPEAPAQPPAPPQPEAPAQPPAPAEPPAPTQPPAPVENPFAT
jgi:tetratricopeptide (TPR) repeat protein